MDKNVSTENLRKKCSVGVLIGLILVIITFVFQCVAFSTANWKEISTNSATLYVDGVDALIRTEVLHYFDSVHRSRRQTYGLFLRCEIFDSNNSTIERQKSPCRKNYLPSYPDENFNECHSLPYYRFCIKSNEKNFDIAQDYLRAAFDVGTSSTSTSTSCDCQYPTYVVACQIIGIFALIFLLIFAVIFLLFLFIRDTHYRLKLKCFGILIGLFASVLMLIILILTSQHLTYESIEYLIAIERHYKITQIYKLSQDTKLAIDRFLQTIDVNIGYSAILAWIAFSLSIINLIFFISTCKISHEHPEDEKQRRPMISPSSSSEHHDDSTIPLKFEEISPPVVRPDPMNETTSFSFNSIRDRRSVAPSFAVEDEV